MIKLEPITPPIVLRRAWTIFFSEGDPGFWRYFTRPGFRHVEAAAFYADENRWVFVIPSRRRLLVEVKKPEDAGPYLSAMMANCTVAVRFNGQELRNYAPLGAGCVGTVKGLCGIKSRALWPGGLLRDLLAQGAEIVHGNPVFQAGNPARRPGSGETARAGAGACEAGPDQGDARTVAA